MSKNGRTHFGLLRAGIGAWSNVAQRPARFHNFFWPPLECSRHAPRAVTGAVFGSVSGFMQGQYWSRRYGTRSAPDTLGGRLVESNLSNGKERPIWPKSSDDWATKFELTPACFDSAEWLTIG